MIKTMGGGFAVDHYLSGSETLTELNDFLDGFGICMALSQDGILYLSYEDETNSYIEGIITSPGGNASKAEFNNRFNLNVMGTPGTNVVGCNEMNLKTTVTQYVPDTITYDVTTTETATTDPTTVTNTATQTITTTTTTTSTTTSVQTVTSEPTTVTNTSTETITTTQIDTTTKFKTILSEAMTVVTSTTDTITSTRTETIQTTSIETITSEPTTVTTAVTQTIATTTTQITTTTVETTQTVTTTRTVDGAATLTVTTTTTSTSTTVHTSKMVSYTTTTWTETLTVPPTESTTITINMTWTFTVDNTTTKLATHQTSWTHVFEKTSTTAVTHTITQTFTIPTVGTIVSTRLTTGTLDVQTFSTKNITYVVAQTFTVDAISTVPVTLTVIATGLVNTTSVIITPTTNTINMTADTKLSQLGLSSAGYITVVSDGSQYVVTVDANNVVGDMLNSLAGLGIFGNITNGILSLSGDRQAYILGMSSSLSNAFKLTGNSFSTNTHTIFANTNSNKQFETNTANATGTTLLKDLRKNGSAPASYKIILNTKSDAGNQLVTLSFSATATIHNVCDELAKYGLDAMLDYDGRFSLRSSSLTDFDISGDLGIFLMGSYSKYYDLGETRSVSNNLIKKQTFLMDNYTTLSQIGITSGTAKLHINGDIFSLNINANSTVGDFRATLAQYGITSDIINGKLALNSDGVAFLTPGTSNIVNSMNIGFNNWSLGSFSQQSKTLSDTDVKIEIADLKRKLNELTDSSGNALGITSGQIYVYQNGTRNTVNIDSNDTLESLIAKLSQYGISTSLDSNGKLLFFANNNSFISASGLTNPSNILAKLGINKDWAENKSATSQVLKYEVINDITITGDTKLIDLQNSDGYSMGITTGEFTIISNGARYSETITNSTTVDEFLSILAKYGMYTNISSNGEISIGGLHESYLATSASAAPNSNIIDKLFAQWNFVNIYTSNNLTQPEDITVASSRSTKLANINEGSFQDGFISIIHNGIRTDIKICENDTIGTLLDELALFGFSSTINDFGQLIIKSSGNSLLQLYSGPEQASNALDLLGINISGWIQTNSYQAAPVDVIKSATETVAATRNTQLDNLGITTGEYNVFVNGVKFTALISSDETVQSFLDTLQSFNIQANLVINGNASSIQITSPGDIYIAKSKSTTNASNIADVLFSSTGNIETRYNYEGLLQTSHLETTFADATLDTKISDLDIAWSNPALKAQGTLSIEVDGITNAITIDKDETVNSLIDKFRALGLEASISNGQLIVESGYKDFKINTAASSSEIVKDLKLTYHNDLGGYAASSAEVQSTTTTIEDRTLSVANYADNNTQMNLLNITSGNLSIFRNGQRASIQILQEETFGQLQSRIQAVFADVQLSFNNGFLSFSSTSGASVEVGSTTDTSNFSAVTGLVNSKSDSVSSSRQLYKVNGNSKLTTANLFRRGSVCNGTFTIGDAVFSIDENTTVNNLISQINSSADANATAYWDSVDGKLVIKSRTSGSSYINIEAGSSNFSDIMGYTASERKPDNSIISTRIDVNAQDVGQNAVFSINGTKYTSTSNTVGSDITRLTGVTLNLKGISDDGDVTLTVEKDKDTVANAVSDIVDAYNELIANVDKEIARGAKLADQSALKLIRNQIRSLMTSSLSGTSIFRNLDAIGISLDTASAGNISTSTINVLSFNKDKFLSAFDADLDALKHLLIGNDSSAGIFVQVENLVEQALQGATGYFETANKSFDNQIKRLNQKIDRANKAVDNYRARLESKFSAMDLLIANMQNQYSSFL